jgi:hypothetical protein
VWADLSFQRASLMIRSVFMRWCLSRKAVVVLVVLGVVAIAGVAFAYWTAGGSGSGTADTGTAASVTVKQTASPTGLYPGGTVTLSGDFDNTNSGHVYITAVTATVTPFSVQTDGAKPACTQADFSISGSALVAAEIPVGSGVGSWSGLSLNMTDAGTNQDNCKNITVPITYSAS